MSNKYYNFVCFLLCVNIKLNTTRTSMEDAKIKSDSAETKPEKLLFDLCNVEEAFIDELISLGKASDPKITGIINNLTLLTNMNGYFPNGNKKTFLKLLKYHNQWAEDSKHEAVKVLLRFRKVDEFLSTDKHESIPNCVVCNSDPICLTKAIHWNSQWMGSFLCKSCNTDCKFEFKML
jgi:hypothetical protein